MDWVGLNANGEPVKITVSVMAQYMRKHQGMKKWRHFCFIQIPLRSKFFGEKLRGARLVTKAPTEAHLYMGALRAGWPDVAAYLLKDSGIPSDSGEYLEALKTINAMLAEAGLQSRFLNVDKAEEVVSNNDPDTCSDAQCTECDQIRKNRETDSAPKSNQNGVSASNEGDNCSGHDLSANGSPIDDDPDHRVLEDSASGA